MKRYFGDVSSYAGVQTEDRCVVQGCSVTTIPLSIAEIAHDEYSAQGHKQPLDRINERGGFGIYEVITLLADHVNRLKSQKGE